MFNQARLRLVGLSSALVVRPDIGAMHLRCSGIFEKLTLAHRVLKLPSYPRQEIDPSNCRGADGHKVIRYFPLAAHNVRPTG